MNNLVASYCCVQMAVQTLKCPTAGDLLLVALVT
jgi:hypothetical protein